MTTDITTAQPSLDTTPRKNWPQKMRGFTLIELGIVLTIVAILALFAIPRVQSYLINGRVQPTAAEVSTAISQIRALAATNTASTQPYLAASGLTIVHFASFLRDRANALLVGGTSLAPTVTHRLGAPGALVTFGEGTVSLAGDSFILSFATVNGAACADLASGLQVQARKIVITPAGGPAATVKDLGLATPQQYNATLAQTTCILGDSNTVAFTIQ